MNGFGNTKNTYSKALNVTLTIKNLVAGWECRTFGRQPRCQPAAKGLKLELRLRHVLPGKDESKVLERQKMHSTQSSAADIQVLLTLLSSHPVLGTRLQQRSGPRTGL